MQLYEMLNELLELLILCSEEEIKEGTYDLNISNNFFKINNHNCYFSLYKRILSTEKKLQSNFASSTLEEFIRNQTINHKISQKHFIAQDNTDFFQELTSRKKRDLKFITTIPNIILDIKNLPINLGCFSLDKFPHEFKNGTKYPLLGSKTYLGLIINKVSDPLLASYKASATFVDFVRIILFITNRPDYKYHLQISNEHQQDSNSECILNSRGVYNYQAYDLSSDELVTGRLDESSIKLHISHLLRSQESCKLEKIWDFYQKHHENTDLTDIQKRILNASLAVGESIRSEEEKNSLIYTCIAFEALFSFDDRQLFQRSIADKLSDCLAFIIGENKEDRKEIIKFTKEIYTARSALIHGSESSTNVNFHKMSALLRNAIIELLNNKKYEDLKTINQLYNMITDAKLSYERN